MPNDLAAIRKQQEENLNQFLAGQPGDLEASLGRTRAGAVASREQTFNPFVSRVGASLGVNFGGAAAAANNTYQDRLNSALSGTLDKQRLSGNQDHVTRLWENAYRRAKESKADEQSARAYAYQVASDAARQKFQIGQDQLNAQQSFKNEDIKDYYQGQGLQMQSQYDNNSNGYEQALARALGGLAGAGLTAYGISKYGQQAPMTNDVPAASTFDMPIGPYKPVGTPTYIPNNVGISRATGGYR